MSAPLAPRILFEDTHLMVISKPAGLLSQGESTGDENLVDWCRGYFGRNYVGLVHRLDRNTSGVMVVAKRTKSAERLTRSLQDGDLVRIYLAWVLGAMKEPATWEHVLEKDERTNITRVRPAGGAAKNGKAARLTATPLEVGEFQGMPLTLVRYELETGRSHQIRAQSAYEGHPLLGDSKYLKASRSPIDSSWVRKAESFRRPALHSWELSFTHPMTKEKMKFVDPLPAELEAFRK